MKKIFLIFILSLTFAGILLSQTIEWSEPIQVSERGGAVSLFGDSEGRMWVGWIEDSIAYARYYFEAETSEIFVVYDDLEPTAASRPMVWGESADRLVWAFVTRAGVMSGASFNGIDWTDTLCFDPFYCSYNERQITFTDSLGQLLVFYTCGTQIYYYLWDFDEWSGPYIATGTHYSPLYPLSVIYDSSGALQFYFQSCGISITVPVYYNEMFVGLDSVSDRRSVLYHTGSDQCYINIFPESDGDVFSFDLFDAIAFNVGKLWSLYYRSGIVESCYVDSAASLPLRVRAVNTWGPINKLETGNYLITWTVLNSVDTTYIAKFDTSSSIIETLLAIPDSIITTITLDSRNIIWHTITGTGILIKHSVDTTDCIEENDNKVPDCYIESISPNPFNSGFRLQLSLPAEGDYRLLIYDINGKQTKAFNKKTLQKGKQTISVNSDDLSSGFYFVVITTEGLILDSKKLILIK